MKGKRGHRDPEKTKKNINAGFIIICAFILIQLVLLSIFGFDSLKPMWAFSIGIDSVALVACAILYYSVMNDSEVIDYHNVIFAILLFVNALGLAIDMAAWAVEGIPQLALLNRVLNSLLFANNNTLTYVFWMYVSYAIGSDKRVQISSYKPLMVIYVISQILCLSNIFYPVMFSVDSGGHYQRASLYPLCILFMVAIIPPFVERLRRSEASRRDKLITSSFFVLPLASQALSTAFFGITAVQAAALIAILLVHGVLVADRGKRLESTRTELDMAAQIQAAMMPSIFPAFPELPEFDIYASMKPAKEVGGDFYDFFLTDSDHLCIVMADVSGKGVPASLFMMISKIILQSCAMLDLSAVETLRKTNEAICSNNPMEMFVTVWLGILDLNTGRLVAANAGHEYPALMHRGGRFDLLKDKHGLVLGALDEAVYDEYEIMMEPGSKIFLYTDGVPEASDENENMFGLERMIKALNREPEADPVGILGNVRDAVSNFTGAAEQFDDMTMLCIEYKGRN